MTEKSVTLDELERILTKQFEQQTEMLKKEISRLSDELKQTSQLAEKNQQEIDRLTSENLALKEEVKSIRKNDIQELEERIENRTNRMLRKTLVFKNIPETANESWAETEKILAKTIHEIAEVPEAEAARYIERAHRGATVEKREGPRPIFCAFYAWKDSELVKERFKMDNIQNRGKVYAEQKYGPMTTKRRNEALKARKVLKSENKIISGYVAHPAKLMVRTEAGARYHLHNDFSTMKVVFKKQ